MPRSPSFLAFCLSLSAILLSPCTSIAAAATSREIQTDLLIVGGSESAVAAAAQAARLGVPSIVLVNDIDWLGGQFTAEGLGAVDEWTIYKGQKVPFPRSGIFLEVMDAIEADMLARYGHKRPGNCFCAWTTCEPLPAKRIFDRLVAPYVAAGKGPLTIETHFEPVRVEVQAGAVTAVEFASTKDPQTRLTVRAAITIDASDLGDVIRLSGAKYLRGPELFERFAEPSAPKATGLMDPNEMNPLTYCLLLRESPEPVTIARPAGYDERQYYSTTGATKREFADLGWPKGTMAPWAKAWIDSTMAKGPYNESPTIYTHRRLVDRIHLKLPAGSECVLVNFPPQDYPTYDFPQSVVEALEAHTPGASKWNLVDMSPDLRRIVYADAKRHALGMLYHLQTTVADRQPPGEITFRSLDLTDEFGTPDRLPPKPYLREGLRLEALYMLKEQDVRDVDQKQSWATTMAADSVFGFQFNIDFHPTRRIYLAGRDGPWGLIHSPSRNWDTHTDRACFPLRSLVPIEIRGLLGAGKNLGYSSLVASAVRLHGHGMHAGQAAATIAQVALAQQISPQQLAADVRLVRRVQALLLDPPLDPITKQRPPGVLLYPYQDVPVDSPYFIAASRLALYGILPGDAGEQDFLADRKVTRREVVAALGRLLVELGRSDEAIAKLAFDGTEPEQPATMRWSQAQFMRAELSQPNDDAGPVNDAGPDVPLTRGQLALELAKALQ